MQYNGINVQRTPTPTNWNPTNDRYLLDWHIKWHTLLNFLEINWQIFLSLVFYSFATRDASTSKQLDKAKPKGKPRKSLGSGNGGVNFSLSVCLKSLANFVWHRRVRDNGNDQLMVEHFDWMLYGRAFFRAILRFYMYIRHDRHTIPWWKSLSHQSVCPCAKQQCFFRLVLLGLCLCLRAVCVCVRSLFFLTWCCSSSFHHTFAILIRGLCLFLPENILDFAYVLFIHNNKFRFFLVCVARKQNQSKNVDMRKNKTERIIAMNVLARALTLTVERPQVTRNKSKC